MNDRVDFHRSGKEVDVSHGHGRIWPALLHLHVQALVQQCRQLPAANTYQVTCNTEIEEQ